MFVYPSAFIVHFRFSFLFSYIFFHIMFPFRFPFLVHCLFPVLCHSPCPFVLPCFFHVLCSVLCAVMSFYCFCVLSLYMSFFIVPVRIIFLPHPTMVAGQTIEC